MCAFQCVLCVCVRDLWVWNVNNNSKQNTYTNSTPACSCKKSCHKNPQMLLLSICHRCHHTVSPLPSEQRNRSWRWEIAVSVAPAEVATLADSFVAEGVTFGNHTRSQGATLQEVEGNKLPKKNKRNGAFCVPVLQEKSRKRERVLHNFITKKWRDEYFSYFLFFVVINLKMEILLPLKPIQRWFKQRFERIEIPPIHVYFSLSSPLLVFSERKEQECLQFKEFRAATRKDSRWLPKLFYLYAYKRIF